MPLKLLFVKVYCFSHNLFLVNGVLMDGILYQYKLEYFQEIGA